jgi:hypothetical protein
MTKALHHKSAVFAGHIELSPFKLQSKIIPLDKNSRFVMKGFCHKIVCFSQLTLIQVTVYTSAFV